MKKSDFNDEINIIDLIIIVWKKKWQIISLIIFIQVVVYFYLSTTNKNPKKFNVTYEIRPITFYDETKYNVYNFFLDQIKPDYILNSDYSYSNNNQINQNLSKSKYSGVLQDKSVISNIDKRYLYNLFIDKISQRPYLIKAIREFKYFDNENNLETNNYDEELSKLAYSIEVKYNETRAFSALIKHKTLDQEKWSDFLKFLQTKINNEIQRDISEILNDYLDYSKKIKKFTLEDIDLQLLASQTVDEKNILKQRKKIIQENKYVERMQDTLSNSIVNSDKFYAAKIIYVSSIKENKSASKFKILALTGLLSLLLGIFITLIAHAIQNRR